MKLLRIAGAGAALAAIAVAANAASGVVIAKSAEIKGKAAADLAAKFATVCGLKDWHPAVAACDETTEGKDAFRTLTLKDGAQVKEKITSKSAEGYGYTIVESPFPVKDYRATFSIKDEAGTAKISWVASFQANGKREAEAKTIMDSVLGGGMTNLAELAAK